MTLREIDRQYKHWAVYPAPSIALVRIGIALGLPPPEVPEAAQAAPSSEAELRAFAASLGVTGG